MKYIFRGLELFNYDENNKKLHVVYADDYVTHTNIDVCKLIPEDYMNFARFFNTIYMFENGDIDVTELRDIEVN